MITRAAPAATAGPWRLVLAAPCAWISANDGMHWGARPALLDRWRNAAYLSLLARFGGRADAPPKQMDRVRVDIECHFRDRQHRDAANYHPTAKPVVDALGPPFLRRPTRRQPRGRSAPGFGLLVDDTPAHLDGPHVTIGRLWREVATEELRTGMALRDTLRRTCPGGMTVTITDLSGGTTDAGT